MYKRQEEGEWPQEDYSGIKEVKQSENEVIIISGKEYGSVPLLLEEKIRYCRIKEGENRICISHT